MDFIYELQKAVNEEVERAVLKHGPLLNCYHGYGVIKEEFEEVWQAIMADNNAQQCEESIQLLCTIVRYLHYVVNFPMGDEMNSRMKSCFERQLNFQWMNAHEAYAHLEIQFDCFKRDYNTTSYVIVGSNLFTLAGMVMKFIFDCHRDHFQAKRQGFILGMGASC